MKTALVLSTHAAQFNAVALKGDLEDNVAKIASWGYQGVELAIRDPSLVDPAQLEELTRRHGLGVPAIGTGQAWGEEGLSYTDADSSVRRAAIDRTIRHVPVAGRLGALIIIGLLRGVVRPSVERARAYEWMVGALQECCRAAEAEGVKLALEPLNRYETTLVTTVDEGLRLIEDVGAPNLGLLLDTFHMNIEEPSIEGSIAACGPHILHFHLADSNRHYPGAGHLDFSRIVGALEATGYTGWLSGEFMPLPDADTSGRLAIEHLRRLGLVS